MKKTFLLLPLLLSLFSCTYEKGEVPQPDLTCITDPVIHTVNVTISDYSFSPINIEILEGDTVRWSYSGSGVDPHTTTCDGTNGSTFPSGGTSWDSGTTNPLMPGNTYQKAITVAGTYNYICQFHAPMMVGTIIVKKRCH
jgi:plastocyanin